MHGTDLIRDLLLLVTLAKLWRLTALLAIAGTRRTRDAAARHGAQVYAARALFVAASLAVAACIAVLSVRAMPGSFSLILWLAFLGCPSALAWRPALRLHDIARRRLRRSLAPFAGHS